MEAYELPVPGTARGQRTRGQLMEAAEEVFGELGYEKASVTAITQAAGVAQGTFYIYFPSKHSIFVELVKDFSVRVRRALRDAADTLPAGASRGTIEVRGMEALFAFGLEHPGLYHIVREAQFVAPDAYRWYYTSFVDAYVTHFRDLSGRLPRSVDLESIGWAIAGMADMLGLRWVVWAKQLPPRKVLEQLVTLLDRGFEGLASR